MLVKDTPVLILAFNRFEKFKTCINTLYDIGFRNVYLSLDGPRNNQDILNQSKIKSVFKDFASLENCNFKSNFFSSNLGCRKGVIKGISWFFSNEKFGLIVEDDILLSSNVCKAFCELLQKYETDENIFSISSFNEFVIKDKNQIVKCPVFRSWGWATWAKKWEEHIKLSEIIEKSTMRECLNYLPKNLQNINNIKKVKACHLGFLDTWDYEYNFTHLALSKYSITFTGQNCNNIGFDSEATHTKKNSSNSIDFSKFSNLSIDTEKEITLENYLIKLLLKKCGFYQTEKNISSNKLFILLITYKIAFVFYLKKFKRKIFKRLIFKN